MLETPKEGQVTPQERIESLKERLGITSDLNLADALEDLSQRRERDAEKKKYEKEKMEIEKQNGIVAMKARRDDVIEDFKNAAEKCDGKIVSCRFWVEVLRDCIKEYRIFAAEVGASDEESGLVVHHEIPEGMNLGAKGFKFSDVWNAKAAIVPREDGSDIVDIYYE